MDETTPTAHRVAPARHFIGGAFSDSESGATFPVVDPATGEVATVAASGSKAEVDRAVAAARAAFDGGEWSRAKPAFRREVLMRVADLIDARYPEINRL